MRTKSRREVLALAAMGAVLRRHAGAQQGAPSIMYRDYSRCLPTICATWRSGLYQSRNRAISSLTTPAAIRKRQQWVTETFWSLIGGMPDRTPLNARTVGSFERPKYRVEKVVYESQRTSTSPELCTYRPSGARRFRACCTRWATQPTERATPLINSAARHWQGSVTWCSDSTQWDRGSALTIRGGCLRHSRLGADEDTYLPGRQMLLKGTTSTWLQTWDAVRSLDYLASHPNGGSQTAGCDRAIRRRHRHDVFGGGR
jgi:hypothetical protein